MFPLNYKNKLDLLCKHDEQTVEEALLVSVWLVRVPDFHRIARISGDMVAHDYVGNSTVKWKRFKKAFSKIGNLLP